MSITYINPYTSAILLLYENFITEQYTLINNAHLNVVTELSNSSESFLDDRFSIVVEEKIIKGTWTEEYSMIKIQKNDTLCLVQKDILLSFSDMTFYRVQDSKFRTKMLLLLSVAMNYTKAIEQIKNKSTINPDGFGRGSISKNLNLSHQIILS